MVKLLKILKSKELWLYLLRMIVMFLKLLIMIILTKKLGSENYGHYSYFFSLAEYVVLFVGFGIVESVGRSVLKNQKQENEYVMLGLLAGLVVSVLNFMVIYVAIRNDYDKGVLLIISFFSLGVFYRKLCNELSVYAKKMRIMYYLELVISMLILLQIFFIDEYKIIIIIQLAIYTVVSLVFIILSFKPKLKRDHLKDNIRDIIREEKEYGFNIYLGKIASMGTYDLDKIMLRYFSPIQYVGYYNIGLMIISPITLVTDTILNVNFSSFYSLKKIPKKIFYLNIGLTLILIILFNTIGKYIFDIIWGAEYSEIKSMFIFFSAIALLRSIYLPLNKFIGAKGKSKYLRDSAFILSFFNIMLNIVFIPKYGLIGALIATIIALLVNVVLHFWFYMQTIK